MMKIITIILFAMGFLFSQISPLKAQDKALQTFQTSLKSGNVNALLQGVSEDVDLNLNGERQSVSKTQFKSLMQQFISDNPVSDLKEKYKGSAGSSSYAILNYTSSKGAYKITIKTEGETVKRVDISKQ